MRTISVRSSRSAACTSFSTTEGKHHGPQTRQQEHAARAGAGRALEPGEGARSPGEADEVKAILGAGLAGLLAAHAWPKATVYEREDGPRLNHKSLLRFRSEAVSNLTGIEFRKVLVRKSIYSRGAFRTPNPQLANLYARKIFGRLDVGDRSIWNTAPVERWIAPPDFFERLMQNVGDRVEYGAKAAASKLLAAADPFVSTIPLNEMADIASEPHKLRLIKSPIITSRYAVEDCDLHQTIYFPDPDTSIYRASITDNILIVESSGLAPQKAEDRARVSEVFGLDRWNTPAFIDETPQSFGKIAPEPDDAARRNLLYRLSANAGVYSLGRFATWRNVLLDDVVGDISVIKRLVAGDAYAARKAA